MHLDAVGLSSAWHRVHLKWSTRATADDIDRAIDDPCRKTFHGMTGGRFAIVLTRFGKLALFHVYPCVLRMILCLQGV